MDRPLSIHGMQAGDIYDDGQGGKWAVQGLWTEPVVIMEQVWPPQAPSRQPRTMQGGVSGLMWQGFRKLVSEEPKP